MTTIKTLKEAIPEYVKFLEVEGKSKSTRYTVNLDLNYLLNDLGEKKELKNILTVHIAKFFKSDVVNKSKDKPRSIHTINQIKRITRQFLVWCKTQGYIDVLPLTKEESKFLNGNKKKAKQKKEEKEKEQKPVDKNIEKTIIINAEPLTEQLETEITNVTAEPVSDNADNNEG